MTPRREHALPTGTSALKAPVAPPVPPPRQREEPAQADEELAPDAEPEVEPDDEGAGDAADGLAPPPAVERVLRVQFNSKIRPDLADRVRAFALLNRSTVQTVMEAAFAEYMDRRGYTEKLWRRGQKRR